MLKRDLYYERIPTKSLRDDVRYLGNILGRVIKKQEGESFFNLVEKIRLLSKANIKNTNNKNRFKKITSEIQRLSSIKIFKLARAFTHFMNFINLTESIDASRNLDEYENSNLKDKHKNIFIEEIFENLFKNKKIKPQKIYNIAKSLHIGIVLTAHPTEVKRRTLIQKYHKITEIMDQRDLLKHKPSRLKILDKKLMTLFDMGEASAKNTKKSTMVVESHITYNQEVKEGDVVDVNLIYFDHDKKRLQYKLEMIHKEKKFLVSTIETLSLYVDLNQRKVAEFEDEKVKMMDQYIQENSSNFNSENLKFSGKLKK